MMLSAFRQLRGPNRYLSRSVLVGRVDAADAPAPDLAGIRAALGATFHLVADADADPRHGGGRLVEQVMRALSARIGRPVGYSTAEPVAGGWDVVSECPPDEPAGSTVGEGLLLLALDLVAGRTAGAADRLAALGAEHRRETLDPWTAAVAEAARERRIPVRRVGSDDLLRLGYGRHCRLVRAGLTDTTSAVGAAATGDRLLARQLLADRGLPVPPGAAAHGVQPAEDLLDALGGPVTVRPRYGGRSFHGLRGPEDIRGAFAEGSLGEVLVERELPGRDYHALVVAGRVVVAVRTGDARTAEDVTDRTHPDVAELCRRVAGAAGLDIAGIDLRLPDITAPLPPAGPDGEPGYAVAGLRAGPDPDLTVPAERRAAAGRAIVEALFPPGALTRIPTVAVTGGGSAGTARLVAHLLGEGGRRIGRAGPCGATIADRPVGRGAPDAGPDAVNLVLGDPTVDAAVLEVASATLTGHGLGYDWTDVAVITGSGPAPEDPATVGSVVAASVRDGGSVVLDAGDPAAATVLAGLGRTQVLLYAEDPAGPLVQAHTRAGGSAYVLEGGWLTELRNCYKARVLPVEQVPCGTGVPAALAALAAATAHGLSPATIKRRLAAVDTRAASGAAVVRIAPTHAGEPLEVRPAVERAA